MEHETTAEAKPSSQNVALPLTDKKNRTVDQVSIIEDIMEQRRTPDVYLIITNVSKPKNIKSALNLTAATGYRRYSLLRSKDIRYGSRRI
jgi:hypothetical protein